MVVLSTIDNMDNNELIAYLYVCICIVINVALSRDQCSTNRKFIPCESIYCELLKTLQFTFNRYLQLKPDLRYVIRV